MSSSYRDFSLYLDLKETGNQLTIRASASAGEAIERIPFDLSQRFLKNQRKLLSDYDEDFVKEIGAQIFSSMFPGQINELYSINLGMIKEEWLRISIYTSNPKIAAIPWELAYDAKRRNFLSLDPRTTILRRWPATPSYRSFGNKNRLRILGVFSSPRDLPSLQLQKERDLLKEALQIPEDRGLVEFNIVEGPATLDRVAAQLKNEVYDVLHFSGHGYVDQISARGGLIFENESGLSHRVDAEDLAILLKGHELSLFTMLSEFSALFGEDARIQAITVALIEAGLPAAIGLQSIISDLSAIRFVQSFFSSIMDGIPLEHAMSEARRTVWLQARKSFEWAAPVLYTSDSLSNTLLFSPTKHEYIYNVGGNVVGTSITNIGGSVISGGDVFSVKQEIQNVGKGEQITGANINILELEKPTPKILVMEDVPGLVSDLKAAINKEQMLSPLERIEGLAAAEELRFALSLKPIEKTRVESLLRKVSSSGPEPARVVADWQKRVSIG